MLEINEATKRDILAKDHEDQQRLHDVESQWVEGVVEVGTVAASASWLAGQVDEVSREQRSKYRGDSPESSWPPERAC